MAIWSTSDVVRVNLPPDEPSNGGDSQPPKEKPEVEDTYIEPPENQEEDSSSGGSSSFQDEEDQENDTNPKGSDSEKPDDSKEKEDGDSASSGSEKEDGDPEQDAAPISGKKPEEAGVDEADSEDPSGDEGESSLEDNDAGDTEGDEDGDEDGGESAPLGGPEEGDEGDEVDGSKSSGSNAKSTDEPEYDSDSDAEDSVGGEENSEGGEDGTDCDSESTAEESDEEGTDSDSNSSEDGEESTGSDEDSPDGGSEDSDSNADPSDPVKDDSELEESDVPDLSEDEAEQVRRVLQALQEELEDLDVLEVRDISEELKDKLNSVAVHAPGAYLVHPSVRDNIYKVLGDRNDAQRSLSIGMQEFGNLGVRLRNLFTDRRSLVVESGLKKGKRISGRDLPKSITDRAAGRMPRIWKKELEGRNIDAAVSIAVDNSSSMRGLRAFMAERLTMALGVTLERMRIPFEIMGYTQNGNPFPPGAGAGAAAAHAQGIRVTPVDINVIKTFEERQFDIARCVTPDNMGATPDLDCLRILAPRLLARPEPKKILFVFTDGEPTVSGGGNIQQRLQSSLKSYIKDLRKAGVVVFGFGMEANLKAYYGEDFIYVSSSDMSQFPTMVMEKLSKLLLT